MRFHVSLLVFNLVFWSVCCSTDAKKNAGENNDMDSAPAMVSVTGVSVSGPENEYTFSVTLKSPDTGCDQYADWWEVVDMEGKLLYRRILTHSHAKEQPFTRPGGTVDISEGQLVYIRGHMNNSGYGTKAFKGSAANGFSSQELDVEFAKNLQKMEPLPQGCAF